MLYDTLQIPFSVLSIIRNMNFGWPLVLDHGNMINQTLAFSPFTMVVQVYTKGNPYGIDEDLVFSMPCRSKVSHSSHIIL